MGMVCDTCGKDAGNQDITCEKCVKELKGELEHSQEQYDALREDYEQLRNEYKELQEKYNAPIMKFARGELKDEPKSDT